MHVPIYKYIGVGVIVPQHMPLPATQTCTAHGLMKPHAQEDPTSASITTAGGSGRPILTARRLELGTFNASSLKPYQIRSGALPRVLETSSKRSP